MTSPKETEFFAQGQVTDMVECIEEMTRYAGSQAMRKLASDMDL